MKNMKRFLLSSLALGVFFGALEAQTFAVVDGQDITDKELKMILRAMPGAEYDTLPKDMQQQVIDQAIEQHLLLKQAKKDGIKNTKEYKEALKDAEDELALGLWMKEKLDSVIVSDSEARDFYSKNKNLFQEEEQVKARHILVKSEKEAKEIIKKLDKAPKGKLKETFSELSSKHSLDESIAQSGGDLGWFTKEQMVPEFSDAAFALAKGNYTKTPVKTTFGYHIIFVEDKKASGVAPFESVKDRVVHGIKMQKFRDNVGEIAQNLKKNAKIELK